jgi:hypothetical protein
LEGFWGYHSEWNLGSPGGWDYQRTTQEIGKAVWEKLNRIHPTGVNLDFDHPLLYPVVGFAEMLVDVHRSREGSNPGVIAVVAEEETLEDVSENINLAHRLNRVDGITGVLIAPHELELRRGKVSFQGHPVSVIFMDFNTDVLLNLHRKHNLIPLLQAVCEHRVINPRGTEPINVKSMFEVLSGPHNSRFHPEVVRRTPWTRRFYPQKTKGPKGEEIRDLVEWTRAHWDNLVLKPTRGYSGRGVRVGGVHEDAEEAIELALKGEEYIVQEKIPLALWAEEIPEFGEKEGCLVLKSFQTDFRCLVGPGVVFGFLCRFGMVPTNVGSGGGVQPLGILNSDMSVREAADRINQVLFDISQQDLTELLEMQKSMALEQRFTYLLGPIKIALRPRVITTGQIEALKDYCIALWADCVTLEKMWLSGELDEIVEIETEELEIARSQPWGGSPAIIASDGLFSFGASVENHHGHQD